MVPAEAYARRASRGKVIVDDSQGEASEPVSAGRAADSGASSAAEPQLRTFLIADIRGYTRFTQTRGDEAAGMLAGRFAELVFAGVAARGGHLLELRGDEALVVFASARQALRAAVELQQRFAQECVDEPSLPLLVGIGVDAGEAVAVGDGFRGAALNRAARLCSHAGPGEVLASDGVVHMAGAVDEVRFVRPESLRLKGMQQPVGVVRVVAGSPSRREALAWQARRTARRVRRSRVAWASLAVAALAAVAVALLVQRSSAPRTLSSAPPNSVALIDSSGRIRHAPLVGASPSHAAAGAGLLWVTNFEDDSVSLIDLETHSVTQTIQVGHGPTGIAVGGDSVWVANSLDGTLSRIDLLARRVVEEPRRIGNNPSGVLFADGLIWVALAGDQRILRIDPRSGTIVGRTELRTSPAELAAGAGAVWASSPDVAAVYRIEVDSPQTAIEIGVGNGASGLVFGFDSLWVANTNDNNVSRIDPASNHVVATPPVGNSPTALAVTGDGIWVTNRYDHTVSRIDPRRDRVTSRTQLGAEPQPILAVGSDVWVGVQAGLGGHRGGTFTELPLVGTIAVEGPLDPATVYGITALPVMRVVYDGLVGFARTGSRAGTELVPDLALAVPRPSADGRSYRFQLRRGIRYSDGSQVRASDFRHALERALQLESVGSAYYGVIVGADRCHPKQRCDLSRGIVTDDRAGTITFSLTAPDGDFLNKLALPYAAAVPSSVSATVRTASHPVPGTGPYTMTASPDPQKRLVLVRNPHFHEWSHAAQPDGFPDRIVLRAADLDHGVAAVLRGAADVVGVPHAHVHEVETRYPTLVKRHPSRTLGSLFLNTRVPPFDDVRARQAINLAIDRRRFIQLNPFIDGDPTCQALPPNFPGYDPYCPYTAGLDHGAWHAPDLARARRLVRASGTAGTRVTFWTGERHNRGDEFVVATLNRLGYRARLKVVPYEKYFGAVADPRNRAQVGAGGYLQPDYPSPAYFINAFYGCPPDRSYLSTGLANATVCAHIRRALAMVVRGDERQANALWRQIDHEIVDLAPFVMIVNPSHIELVSRRVGNYQFNPDIGIVLGQAWVR
jgi:YVTN family beta-propeller protein